MLMKDDWLTSILGKDVFQIDSDLIVNLKSTDLPGSQSLVIAKMPTYAIKECRSLQRLNFYLVDTNVQLQRSVVANENFFRGEGIRFAECSDEQQISKIAGSSFIYDRFHADPSIPDESAEKIKSEWARNFFRGHRGEWMIVAENDGVITGFLQILKAVADDSITIDLIAVHGDQRQRGVAAKMIQFAIENCGMSGGSIKVGTQLSNTPSLSLYIKMGFQITSAQYIFHLHR